MIKKVPHLFILGFALIFFQPDSAAQSLVRFDSLVTALKQNKVTVPQRLDLLLRLTQGYTFIQPKQGIVHGQEGRELASKSNDWYWKSRFAIALAGNYLSLSDKQQARYWIETAKQESERLDKKEVKASALLMEAEIERLLEHQLKSSLQHAVLAMETFKELKQEDGISRAFRCMAAVAIDQRQDSIGLAWNSKSFEVNNKIGNQTGLASNHKLFGQIYLLNASFKTAAAEFRKAQEIYERAGYKYLLSDIYSSLGNTYFKLTDLPKSLDFYQKALRLDEELGNKAGAANNLFQLSSVYGFNNELNQAIHFCNNSLKLYEELENRKGIAKAYGNMGVIFWNNNLFDSAMTYFQKAKEVAGKLDDKSEVATNLWRIGRVNESIKRNAAALESYDQAIQMALKNRDFELYVKVLNDKASLQVNSGKLDDGIRNSKRALEMADSLQLLNSKRAALSSISSGYEYKRQYDSAFKYFQQYSKVKESILNQEKIREFSNIERKYEIDKLNSLFETERKVADEKLSKQSLLAEKQKQALVLNQKELELAKEQKEKEKLNSLRILAELQKEQLEKEKRLRQLTILEQEKKIQQGIISTQEKVQEVQRLELKSKAMQRNVFIAGSVLLALFIFFVYRNYANTLKSNKLITLEKKKSEDLLLNILPEEVALELKEYGKSRARLYPEVTVLFTDFVNFTGISAQLNPEELVNEIDKCFSAFDQIIERHGLEKIKTIGDAYLAVSGLPMPQHDHAKRVVKAAIEIREYMESGNSRFGIRIGIHSGPVVAGIVGSKKYAYDIWGDTVNTAARMEQNSEAGKINISEATRELLGEDIAVEARGKIQAKNKGFVEMYYVA
ncbi:MAG: tetratricopeptide repeat protein [Bacteroidetes bacterium]|nr:tetratricopeptide repeat protein [Bacteroidota bacterium]